MHNPDQRREVEDSMRFLGLDPAGLIDQVDFTRIREFVWSERRRKAAELRRLAKYPSVIGSVVDGLLHEGPQSKPEEILLWAMSQRSLLIGEFRPQMRVGPYFLDFGFEKIKLGVEVDGRAFHSSPADQECDRRRGAYLAKCGWTLLRFAASEVMRDSITIAGRIGQTIALLQKQHSLPEAWER